MTQYDFIHKKLFPLLSFQAKQLIANFVSNNFQIEKCIEALNERKTILQLEVNNLEAAIHLLKTIK